MADLRILIVKSESTAELEAEGTVVEMLSIDVPNANIAAANSELAGISNVNWTSSTTVTQRNGYTTDGILLPEEAVTG